MNVARVPVIVMIIAILFFSTIHLASGIPDNTEKSKPHLSDRIQVPFIGNKGLIEDNEVAFIAGLSDLTVYIKQNGTITYNFLLEGKDNNSINEIFTPQKITLVPLEPPPDDIIAIYKQKGQIKDDIINYYRMSLGEIYQGVELELTAFTDSLEKLLTVLSQGNPDLIHIKLEGIKGLKVDKSGMLEMATAQGSIKLTKPYAYQVVEDERKPIEVSYRIHKDTTYGFKLGTYDKNKPLMINYKTRKGES